MSITDRDKKIMLVVVPLVAVLGFWFLLLSPKRQEAAKAGEELAKQEERRDRAQEQERSLDTAKADFASHYRELVRLGKAVPTSVDMPSLLVQLDSAARGTGIKFNKIASGPPTAPAAAAGGGSAPDQQSQGGGDSQKSSGEEGSETDTQTATTAREGGVPVGGGATGQGGAQQQGAASGAAGLEKVPLDLEFSGSFFRLADFFHRLKRFVRVVNSKVLVGGRLMTIDSLKFTSGQGTFPGLSAEIKATVYLTPKSEGATAGADPQGPAQSQPAESGDSTPQPSTSQPPAPAAAASP